MRTIAPYAGEPEDLSPFAKFTSPYYRHYVDTNVYVGAARDLPEPKDLTEVRIGFLAPLEHHPEQLFGQRMLHGAQMAIDEANAGGGYGGKPFRLMIHNDYDNWQVASVAEGGTVREPEVWGSASNDVVKMVYDDQVWAIFGSISSESTHIALRVALRAEVPIVNSASTDPTIPETLIPWYFTDLQDDRVQGLTLARHIYTELGLKRIAILRVNSRYGRFGVGKFRDASRRLGHPVVIEQKFRTWDTDYRQQLKTIQESRVDGIVLWTDEKPAAEILKEMRELGMKQRVFGSYRILGDTLLAQAGDAAEGLEAVFPYDPTRTDTRWLDFNQRYEAKYSERPEQFAALAYDAMQVLLESICKAGLNRARIHDALTEVYEYDGVTGHMIFDTNNKNVAPMYLGIVHNGVITYRRVTMERQGTGIRDQGSGGETRDQGIEIREQKPAEPYARVGEDGAGYFGPSITDTVTNPAVVVFGPDAERAVAAKDVVRLLASQPTAGGGAAGLRLIPVASNVEWGKASTALVKALFDQHAVGMIALDRDAAHLAEQMALKRFVPVIALAGDRALTSTNVPWIFRLPAGSGLAQAVGCYREAIEHSGASGDTIRANFASGKPIAGVAFLPSGEPLGDRASLLP
jgi:branched-chain amino acid transport system substrate-binding protein